jgi:hypothetical protein
MRQSVRVTDSGVPQGDGLLGAADVRALAERLGIRPTKQRGQNFVIDGNTVRRIVRTAELRPDDVVIEVGPGLGSLTLALLPAVSRVVAVEIDAALAAALPDTVRARRPDLVDRLEVVHADALTITSLPGPEPTALVANLPYNVSVPVLLHLLEHVPSIRRVLVMVQAEVADRLAAGPGSKVYGVPLGEGALVRRRRACRRRRTHGVLARAERRLRPRRVHQGRAAGHVCNARGGVRGGRRRVRAAAQDAARRAGRLGGLSRSGGGGPACCRSGPVGPGRDARRRRLRPYRRRQARSLIRPLRSRPAVELPFRDRNAARRHRDQPRRLARTW